MSDVVILSGARTGIAKFMGAFSPLTAPQLGAFALKEAMGRGKTQFDGPDGVTVSMTNWPGWVCLAMSGASSRASVSGAMLLGTCN